MIDIVIIEKYLLELQERITAALLQLDAALDLRKDQWDRAEGGGGQTRILHGGKIFERAGINYSDVHGKNLPDAATAQRPELSGSSFRALGNSLVIHPLNPYIPTAHMNIRFFSADKKDGEPVWWFGGGFDLTPYYAFEEDVRHWHNTARDACRDFGNDTYGKYKKWCDAYFYIKHRKEPRGIGGLFFDDLNEWGFERCFAFMQSVGNHFLDAYIPIVKRRKELRWGRRERDFQCYRRGRYAEFNLVYDRGTLFGLQSEGRIESILMSLPPEVHWRYDWQPEPGTPEAELYDVYLKPGDWAD